MNKTELCEICKKNNNDYKVITDSQDNKHFVCWACFENARIIYGWLKDHKKIIQVFDGEPYDKAL